MKLIAITGGSGAGKTTIAHALARHLGDDATVIAEDDYYRCASTFPDFDPATHNFDEPTAKEHQLLHDHLRAAHAGASFNKPIYDLASHRRLQKTERIAPAQILIVEGIHLLHPRDLRSLFDLKVYIEAEESLRLARRMIRDIETRGRTPRSVMDQFFATVRPMHETYVAPQRAYADLILTSQPDSTPTHASAHAARILEALA